MMATVGITGCRVCNCSTSLFAGRVLCLRAVLFHHPGAGSSLPDNILFRTGRGLPAPGYLSTRASAQQAEAPVSSLVNSISNRKVLTSPMGMSMCRGAVLVSKLGER